MTRETVRSVCQALAPTAAIAVLAVLQGCATNPNPYKASEYLILIEQARKIGVVPGLKSEVPVARRVLPLEQRSADAHCSLFGLRPPSATHCFNRNCRIAAYLAQRHDKIA